MRYQITEHGDYVRAVIGDAAGTEDFAAFFRELKILCTVRGFDRALVVVLPDYAVPSPDRLSSFHSAGFIDGFKLALVCAAWTLYQACAKAERAASQAGVQVRAFFQETEGVRWLTAD
jgi:hypothetical protein